MPRVASKVLAAVCLVSMMSATGAVQQFAHCNQAETQVSAAGSATGTTPFLAGAGVVIAEGDAIAGGQTLNDLVTSLSVTLAPSTACPSGSSHPGSSTIQLGLYDSNFALIAHTAAKSLSNAVLLDGNNGVPIKLAVEVPNAETPITLPSGGYYIAIGNTNPNLCLLGSSGGSGGIVANQAYSTVTGLPLAITVKAGTPEFQGSAYLCPSTSVVGDPVFTGFHGQQFTVKGEAGSVFNLISSPALSFNNRFVSLEAGQSMTADAMKEVRAQFKRSKLLDLVKADTVRPPVTTAWNHPGTYMGECGVTLGESELYVAPGAYATGFSAITLNGVALPVSSVALELDGDMTVTRPTAFKVVIATPTVRFTIVNADQFVNIEHAKVTSSDVQLTGLLGQTADAEWEVVQSADFKQHIENDYKVASNELF